MNSPSVTNQEPNADQLSILPVVSFSPTFYNQRLKPIADRVIAATMLVIMVVPMAVVALLIMIFMGRPVLFRQQRVGLNGKTFDVLKFRTMDQDRRYSDGDVDCDQRITHKSGYDPRHTRFGQILRRFSIDELPQLINILRGEMSAIGPRPELVSVVDNSYPEALKQRHLVKPGLTGLWQISARGDGPMHENGQWDLIYVDQISFWTDLKILLKTPFVLFGRHSGV